MPSWRGMRASLPAVEAEQRAASRMTDSAESDPWRSCRGRAVIVEAGEGPGCLGLDAAYRRDPGSRAESRLLFTRRTRRIGSPGASDVSGARRAVGVLGSAALPGSGTYDPGEIVTRGYLSRVCSSLPPSGSAKTAVDRSRVRPARSAAAPTCGLRRPGLSPTTAPLTSAGIRRPAFPATPTSISATGTLGRGCRRRGMRGIRPGSWGRRSARCSNLTGSIRRVADRGQEPPNWVRMVQCPPLPLSPTAPPV